MTYGFFLRARRNDRFRTFVNKELEVLEALAGFMDQLIAIGPGTVIQLPDCV